MNSKTVVTLGVAAGLATLLLYLKRSYNSESSEAVPLALTRQILQEIKYQMLIVSTNFAEQMGQGLMRKIPPSQLEAALLKLRANLMQIYQAKEDIVLNKHGVTREDFLAALETQDGDTAVSQSREEIQKMMDLAVQGKYPDFTVPAEASSVNPKEKVREIYQAVCELVVVAVWKKLRKLSAEDPSFDCKNDEHYKVAVRQVNVYRLRADFLEQTGYSAEWGCPNETFFKVMEKHKQEDQRFRVQAKAVEKAYNYILEIVSNNPFTVQTQEVIHMMMDDEIAENEKKLEEEVGRVRQLEEKEVEGEFAQAGFFFEKGKLLQQSLSESRAKLDLARGVNTRAQKEVGEGKGESTGEGTSEGKG